MKKNLPCYIPWCCALRDPGNKKDACIIHADRRHYQATPVSGPCPNTPKRIKA